MRKFLFTIACCLIFSYNASSQNIAVGIHAGWAAHFGNSTIMGIPVGFNAEWAYNAKHSIGGKAHFSIGPRRQDPHIYYASPEYKYYITGETLDGLYTGAYLGIGGGGGSAYLSAGGLAGYAFTMGEKFNLDTQVQFGYGYFANGRQSAFHVLPSLGIRYMF